MRRFAYIFTAVATLTGVLVYMPHASGDAAGEAAQIFGTKFLPDTATGG